MNDLHDHRLKAEESIIFAAPAPSKSLSYLSLPTSMPHRFRSASLPPSLPPPLPVLVSFSAGDSFDPNSIVSLILETTPGEVPEGAKFQARVIKYHAERKTLTLSHSIECLRLPSDPPTRYFLLQPALSLGR